MSIVLNIVVIYMLLLIGVSFLSAAFQQGNTAEGFLLANKQLTWPLIGVMIAGLAVGGSSTVGVAQNAYTAGLSAGWYNVAWATGPVFAGIFLAMKIRRSNKVTINEMMGTVFGEAFEAVSAMIQIIVFAVIVALQIIAGGAILTAILPEFFTMKLGLIISALMFGIIATTGGLLAASLSNVVNMLVIYTGIILGVFAAVKQYGGFSTINAALPPGISGDGSHWYHLTSGMGLAVIAAWFLTMLIQGLPNGSIIQCFIAAKTPEQARKGAFFSALLMIPGGFLSAIFGIIAAVQFPNIENTAMALPMVAMTLPGWVAGILLAGLWAADISTATGLMIAASTMITQDVLFKHVIDVRNHRKRLWISRLTVASMVVISYIAATKIANILSSLMAAMSLFAPYAILIVAIYWAPNLVRKSSGWGTFSAATVTFIITNFLKPEWCIAGQPIFTVMLVSLIAFFLCLLDKRKAPAHLVMEEKE